MPLTRRRKPPPVCEHLENVPLDPMPGAGCIECLAIGDHWVHLRYCVTCGETRCCDASPNRHASKHAAAVDHPVVRSAEPDEFWAWCFVDAEGVELPESA